MLLSDLIIENYKVLPRKHKSVIFAKYRAQFDYKSNRRLAEILKREIHPTPDEFDFLQSIIIKHSKFYMSQQSCQEPKSFIQIIP